MTVSCHFCPCKKQHCPPLQSDKQIPEPVYNLKNNQKARGILEIQKLSLEIINKGIKSHMENLQKLSTSERLMQMNGVMAIDSPKSKLKERFEQKKALSLEFFGCDKELSEITTSFSK